MIMKKRIILALILIIPAIVFFIENKKYSLINLAEVNHTNLEKIDIFSPFIDIKKDSLHVFKKLKKLDQNWEYIKNNLFNHDFENRKTYLPEKLNSSLLLVLKNASRGDSVIFKSVMEDLRKLIPTKTIAFYSDYTGIPFNESSVNHSSNFENKKINPLNKNHFPILKIRIADFEKEDFLKETTEVTSENLTYTFNNHQDYMWYSTDFLPIYSNFNLTEKKSFEEKKQYTTYKLLKLICFTYPLKSSGGAVKPYPKEAIFNAENKDPWNRKATEKDKFLLQKLFANDFDKQFSNYMYKAYPWRYVNYFLNPGLAKLKAFLLIFLIGILTFVLSFEYFLQKKFQNSYLNYLYPSLFISLHIANLVVIYLYLTNMNLTRYFEQWSAAFIIATLLAVFYSFLLWAIEKIVIKKSFRFSYQLSLKILITFIVLNLPLLIFYIIYTFNANTTAFFDEKPTLPIFIGLFGLSMARGLLMYLNQVSISLVNAKDVELSKLKELHLEAEMKLLQSQINPHFLYNSLNSIASLAKIDAEKTQKMAYSLSDLFKYSINRKDKKTNTIKDEIEMVTSYLEIEKIRFGNRLQFDLDLEKSIEKSEIPLFLIQPLVENAIKHGISKVIENGKIELKIEKKEKNIHISVSDNGPDFPEGLISGHGLQTVYDLLRLNYKNKASLHWTNSPKKTITIQIPETNTYEY